MPHSAAAYPVHSAATSGFPLSRTAVITSASLLPSAAFVPHYADDIRCTYAMTAFRYAPAIHSRCFGGVLPPTPSRTAQRRPHSATTTDNILRSSLPSSAINGDRSGGLNPRTRGCGIHAFAQSFSGILPGSVGGFLRPVGGSVGIARRSRHPCLRQLFAGILPAPGVVPGITRCRPSCRRRRRRRR